MDDGTSIADLIDNCRAAVGLGRELFKLSNDDKFSTKVSDLNERLLDAQQFAVQAKVEQFQLVERVSELQSELVALKRFREEKKNYKLKNIGRTAYVYAYGPLTNPSGPCHWLCVTCF